MKKSKKTYYFIFATLVVAASLYGAFCVWSNQKEGFCVEKILHKVPATAGAMNEDLTILQQPYSFVGRGYSTYIFSSQDGAYRLSFLKQVTSLSEKKKNALLTSYKLASTLLQEEVGFISLQLQPSGLRKPMTLIAAERTFEIDPNQTQFFIQVEPRDVKKHIEELMQEQKVSDAKMVVEQVIALVRSLSDKKVLVAYDKGKKYLNIGLHGDKAMLIDCGKLTLYPKKTTEQLFLVNLHLCKPLNKWLMLHYPVLSSHFHALCKEQLASMQEVNR
jgi:hypothetical protein